MANLGPVRKLTPGPGLGKATGALALAIMFVLTVVASQAAPAQTFNVIHTFTGGQGGKNPFAGLTVDAAGNLYGTATDGGLGYGTAYTLRHSGAGWVFDPLYSFAGGSDGAYPQARVIIGQNGTLYGTTVIGGQACSSGTCGTVFNLRPSAFPCRSAICPGMETVLYRFMGGDDGADPKYGDLIFDQGNIYGTTPEGGSHGYGTVYELTPSGTESVLYSFAGFVGGHDGGHPYGGVVRDNVGRLYGTTHEGGTLNAGTVFELTPSEMGWTEEVIYSFQRSGSGLVPYAGLIVDQSGNLYGATTTTDFFGGGGGTVFELSPSDGSWTYTVLYSFTGNANCGPRANLAMDPAGNLYGTTYCDGANNYGSVFKLTPTLNPPWTYISLHDFTNGSDGELPISNVLIHPNGKLYGTAIGGDQGSGVVWEITP